MAEHPHITLIRTGYAAFSRGDFATLRQLFAADVTQHQPGSSQLSGDFKGADAVLELYTALARESEGTLRVELKQCFTDGAGHVVAVHRTTARRGGKSLDIHEVLSFTLIGDKVVDIAALEEDIEALDAFWG
jgi:ketosteroid isomerase-like protein